MKCEAVLIKTPTERSHNAHGQRRNGLGIQIRVSRNKNRLVCWSL